MSSHGTLFCHNVKRNPVDLALLFDFWGNAGGSGDLNVVFKLDWHRNHPKYFLEIDLKIFVEHLSIQDTMLKWKDVQFTERTIIKRDVTGEMAKDLCINEQETVS